MSTNTLAVLKTDYPHDGDHGPHNTENNALNKLAQVHRYADADELDFLAGVKACDLSGEGTCEACQ